MFKEQFDEQYESNVALYIQSGFCATEEEARKYVVQQGQAVRAQFAEIFD